MDTATRYQWLIAAGAAGILGTLLPWGEIGSGLLSESVNGFHEITGYIGIVTAAAAGGLIVAGIQQTRQALAVGALSGGILFIGGFPWPSTNEPGAAIVSGGIGGWLMFAAGAIGLVLIAQVWHEDSVPRNSASGAGSDPSLLVVGGLGILGSFLPWVTAFGESLGGMAEEFAQIGVLSLACGAAILVFALSKEFTVPWLVPAASGGILVMGLMVLFVIQFGGIGGQKFGSVLSTGIGSWLLVLGGILGALVGTGAVSFSGNAGSASTDQGASGDG